MSGGAEGWEDAELAALGRVAANFAELNWQAGRLLAGFIGPRHVAFIVTAGADFRWTLEKLSVITEEALADPQARAALLGWVKASLHLRERRGHDRLRASGAGPDHDLPFTDRVIVTLVYLRHQLPHAALAALCEVDRSTVTRAVREIRPLLAARGFAVPHRPGLRLRTLADVFAYASSCSVELRIDGTEVQVRRPRVGRPRRKAFVSGKKKMNTEKATVVTDGEGRTLWAGAFLPAACTTRPPCAPRASPTCSPSSPGQSHSRRRVPRTGQGVPRSRPGPPLKPKKDAPPEEVAAWDEARHRQSSEWICVEHANAEHKQWRTLQRYLRRRENFDETYTVVAGLVSDRAAER
jgi:hypothetical protein